jgi:aryl-alcohol dehydrogenase-like predicted oxidoreductase
MLTRTLGRSGIQVSAIGMGGWAIGGPWWKGTHPVGWSKVDDNESIRAIHRALELGINFFDTADVYGCGHSERVLGKALAGKRHQVIIATKFGQTFDETTKQGTGYNVTPEYIHQACDASLRRLNVDVIDLYQLHVKDVDAAQARVVRDVLEDLVAAGKIRWYGWSTDEAASARIFAEGKHCTAIQQRLNIFEGNAETLRVCEENHLASINRNPLAMGLLTGKFSATTTFPDDDIRRDRYDFQGKDAALLQKLERLRAILTADGRTLAQAALGWLLARSERTIPIPGFKTVAQVQDNAGVLQRGALTTTQMKEIAEILQEMNEPMNQ